MMAWLTWFADQVNKKDSEQVQDERMSPLFYKLRWSPLVTVAVVVILLLPIKTVLDLAKVSVHVS